MKEAPDLLLNRTPLQVGVWTTPHVKSNPYSGQRSGSPAILLAQAQLEVLAVALSRALAWEKAWQRSHLNRLGYQRSVKVRTPPGAGYLLTLRDIPARHGDVHGGRHRRVPGRRPVHRRGSRRGTAPTRGDPDDQGEADQHLSRQEAL